MKTDGGFLRNYREILVKSFFFSATILHVDIVSLVMLSSSFVLVIEKKKVILPLKRLLTQKIQTFQP